MRFSITQLLISALLVSATYAHDARGQELLEQRVTLSAETTTLKDALGKIERTSGARFVFNPKEIQLSQRVTLKGQPAPLKVILDELLLPLRIHYEATGKQIALLKDNGSGQILPLQTLPPCPPTRP